MSNFKRLTGKGKVDCPLCLFSSGTLADGKGTTCTCCNGTGKISKRVYNEFMEKYELWD